MALGAAPPHDRRDLTGLEREERNVNVSGNETDRDEVVGAFEGDATSGRVSSASPSGAPIGKSPGAGVEVAAPRGPLALKVITVGPPRALRGSPDRST
jgi:hypothetical protein